MRNYYREEYDRTAREEKFGSELAPDDHIWYRVQGADVREGYVVRVRDHVVQIRDAATDTYAWFERSDVRVIDCEHKITEPED